MAATEKCGVLAAVRLYWPGRDPMYMCVVHAQMAKNVSSAGVSFGDGPGDADRRE